MKVRDYLKLYGRAAALAVLMLAVTLTGALNPASAQKNEKKNSDKNSEAVERILKVERERGNEMLKALKDDLKKNYYDPTFRGMDLDARFKTAQEKIKTTTSPGQIYSIIAQVFVELNDSHTYFLPPDRLVSVDYGWRMQMIGDRCYVIAVKPGSNAAAEGLKVGDLIYSIDGYEPTRENLWKMKYSYYTLKPRGGMHVVIEEPDGSLRDVRFTVQMTLFGRDIESFLKKDKEKKDKEGKGDKEEKEGKGDKEEKEKKQRESRADELPSYHELSKELMVCRMPEFSLTDNEIDRMMKKVEPYQSLILDLRGNPGGYVKALRRVVGYFFDREIKIADTKYRKETKPVMAKKRKEHLFKGKLVVLVDGETGSAAEAFARLMQLEKRGTVIGDRTAGAVMQGELYSHVFDQHAMMTGFIFISPWTVYSLSVTTADIIMPDGQSLEHVGVKPDEVLLPTGADLAARRDPVMARAATLLNFPLDAKQAGALFPGERSTEVITDDPTKQDKEDKEDN